MPRNIDRACPDCGSPARGNPCWYGLDNPEYARSGGDPPCTGYYDDVRDFRRHRRNRRRALGTLAVLIAALLILFFTR